MFSGCVQQTQATGPSQPYQPPAQNQSAQADSGAQPSGTTPAQPADTPSQPDDGGSATQPTQPQTSLKSEEVSFNAGAWKIYGTLYDSQSKTPDRAIILLPMLGKARDSYPISFIERLHNDMPGSLILALDMRGHGKSTNIGTWNSFDSAAFMDMKTDVSSAMKYLEPKYPNVESFYVVGASIGSTAAIGAGAREDMVHRVVMISPGMAYRGVDITSSVDKYKRPLMLISASGDSYSMDAIDEIESMAPASQLTTKIYPGSAHGTDLFADTDGEPDSLEIRIAEFLKK